LTEARIVENLDLKEIQDTVSYEDFTSRMRWMEFSEDDVAMLREVKDLARAYADDVIEELYEHFLGHPETRRFFEDPLTLDYVKRMQREYFLRLTEGPYERDYMIDRLKIGAVHERIGLDVPWYLGAYVRYMRSVATRIFDAYEGDHKRALAAYFALKKLIFLDISLAIDTYFSSRERTIREQQEAIRELSTPALQVRPGLLILPIIGALDTPRALQLTQQLLHAIRATRAKVVVVDITGVPSVDSHVASHLVHTVEASRLMGATVIVSGLSAEVAQALVTVGLEVAKLNTVGDLQGGIEEAERMLGYEVVKLGKNSR
jgi:rsbT co-antagonist protein RsbR